MKKMNKQRFSNSMQKDILESQDGGTCSYSQQRALLDRVHCDCTTIN